MKRSRAIFTSVSTLALVAAAAAWVKPTSFGMVTGPIAAKSLGAITFGPGNVLFAADNDAESVYAIEIADASKASGPIDMAGIDSKIAQALGTTVDQVSIADMAVHPTSHNVYVTVTRGKGVDAKPVLLRVTSDAKQPISVVSLDDIKHSVAKIDNAPASTGAGGRDPHRSTITDLAFTDGNLWIAGLSNEQFSSAFRRMAFPFTNAKETTTLQIYHVSHRRSETQAPVMTFTPTKINGTLYMLAAVHLHADRRVRREQLEEWTGRDRPHRRRARRRKSARRHHLVHVERQGLRARRQSHASDDEAEQRGDRRRAGADDARQRGHRTHRMFRRRARSSSWPISTRTT